MYIHFSHTIIINKYVLEEEMFMRNILSFKLKYIRIKNIHILKTNNLKKKILMKYFYFLLQPQMFPII